MQIHPRTLAKQVTLLRTFNNDIRVVIKWSNVIAIGITGSYCFWQTLQHDDNRIMVSRHQQRKHIRYMIIATGVMKPTNPLATYYYYNYNRFVRDYPGESVPEG